MILVLSALRFAAKTWACSALTTHNQWSTLLGNLKAIAFLTPHPHPTAPLPLLRVKWTYYNLERALEAELRLRPALSPSLPLPVAVRADGRSAARLLSAGYKKCGACGRRFYTATQEKRNDLPWSRSKMLDGHLLLGWLSFAVIVHLLGLPGPTAAYFG